MHYVIVPGINGSGPEHWQSVWESSWQGSESATVARISPASWDFPDLFDWSWSLNLAIRAGGGADTVVVAHSLGCLVAAHWLREPRPEVRGVFLVAAPEQDGAKFPSVEAKSFTGLAIAPIQAPGLLVSSADDEYCDPAAARRLAAGWGVEHVEIGRAGHVNAASGLGSWEAGRTLLDEFTARSAR